jgi:hypothetical protein
MEVSGQIYTPAALSPLKNSQYQVNRRFGELQRLFWHFAEDSNLLLLSGIEPQFLYCPACSLVTIQNCAISTGFKKPNNFMIIRLSIFQPVSSCPY